MKRIIPACAFLLFLCGCMGRDKTETIVMVEPGDVVEVVDKDKVKVQATYKDASGKKQTAISETKIAGTVAMPKSIYRKMRVVYIATYDYSNGKITKEEFQKILREASTGPEDDQKKNVPVKGER